jgi:PKD repeat protein
MRMMNRFQKTIGIMIMGVLLSLIVQAAAVTDRDSITITGVILPHTVPDANFTANVTSGTAPLAVQFSDTSRNSPISWLWDFGDGSTSIEQNPVHTYPSGVFNVSLTVTYTTGSSQMVKLNYIHVSSPPADGGSGSGNPSEPGTGLQSGLTLGQDLFAPVQENLVVSQSMDLSLAGYSTVTSENGQMTLNIDLEKAEEVGAMVTVQGHTVTITQPGFTVEVVAKQVTEETKSIVGLEVQSITLTTTPQEAVVPGVGPVSVSLEAGLSSLPDGATITTAISEPVNPYVLNAFEVAITNEGKEIQAVAYTLTVVKTNIGTTLPATITMTCPPAWIINNGGKEAVSIVRIGDDGKTQVLETRFAGTDLTGNMVFEAKSPAGLSLFGLLTAKATAVQQAENPNSTAAGVSRPAISTNVGMVSWLMALIQQNPIIIIFVVAFVVLGVYYGWWRKRL